MMLLQTCWMASGAFLASSVTLSFFFFMEVPLATSSAAQALCPRYSSNLHSHGSGGARLSELTAAYSTQLKSCCCCTMSAFSMCCCCCVVMQSADQSAACSTCCLYAEAGNRAPLQCVSRGVTRHADLLAAREAAGKDLLVLSFMLRCANRWDADSAGK